MVFYQSHFYNNLFKFSGAMNDQTQTINGTYVLKKWNLLNFHILAYTCYLFAQ